MKKLATSLDYRKEADRLWAEARELEELGFYDMAAILKETSDKLHDLARKVAEAELFIKNRN
jgi:hypothetical protein